MASETTTPPANSRFFVLALGLLVGFVIGFIALLANLPVDQSTVDFTASPVAGEAGDRPRTNFEFYTVLAGGDDGVEPSSSSQVPRQVVEASARASAEELARATAGPDAIPVESPLPAQPVVKPATRVVPGSAQTLNSQRSTTGTTVNTASSNSSQETYFLQAGSFREAQSAERMRASILLLGLEAFIVTRQEASGALGHRVRIGPFHDHDRLTEAKMRLRRGDVAYEIVRVTG